MSTNFSAKDYELQNQKELTNDELNEVTGLAERDIMTVIIVQF